jgi:hypothetical protein
MASGRIAPEPIFFHLLYMWSNSTAPMTEPRCCTLARTTACLDGDEVLDGRFPFVLKPTEISTWNVCLYKVPDLHTLSLFYTQAS